MESAEVLARDLAGGYLVEQCPSGCSSGSDHRQSQYICIANRFSEVPERLSRWRRLRKQLGQGVLVVLPASDRMAVDGLANLCHTGGSDGSPGLIELQALRFPFQPARCNEPARRPPDPRPRPRSRPRRSAPSERPASGPPFAGNCGTGQRCGPGHLPRGSSGNRSSSMKPPRRAGRGDSESMSLGGTASPASQGACNSPASCRRCARPVRTRAQPANRGVARPVGRPRLDRALARDRVAHRSAEHGRYRVERAQGETRFAGAVDARVGSRAPAQPASYRSAAVRTRTPAGACPARSRWYGGTVPQ